MPVALPTITSTIPRANIVNALASETRWAILRHLADGSSLMVTELSSLTGYTPDIISKHTAFLRKTGILITPRIRHLEIAPQFLADKENRILDFGWCALRLNLGA